MRYKLRKHWDEIMLESDKLFEKLIDNLVGLVILEIIKKNANKSEDIN